MEVEQQPWEPNLSIGFALDPHHLMLQLLIHECMFCECSMGTITFGCSLFVASHTGLVYHNITMEYGGQ